MDRSAAWSKALGVTRELVDSYSEIKKRCFEFLSVQTDGVDLNKFNPLSKVTVGNPWASQYDNQTRLSEIKLDVDRTFQEVSYFLKESTRQSLINVLFVFTKNAQLGYRQGMNEICAILFYISGGDEGEAFALLHCMLQGARFHQVDMFSTSTTPNPILIRCDTIFSLLESRDPRLHKHLVANDVSPNLFLVRWIRLLFAREFCFEQILLVWDYFFQEAESPVDSFAVAMLIYARNDLLQSDNSGCFMRLLKFDFQKESISELVNLAKRVENGDKDVLVAAPRIVSPPIVSPKGAARIGPACCQLELVITSLKNKVVSNSIAQEISQLEDIVGFLKLN